ncbi:hypothetical protein PIB30_023764 [Stylosanthes scabra]|uniref:RNase H type-1 domain-containing protein n=1 Tax=Stylosanthes scabra TaxID=79078 RepID=A0ABU6X727_9FABA|nr:hypothetical protein [Stylosanthes scabra]
MRDAPKLIIETDNQQLCQAIKKNTRIAEVLPILEDIKDITRSTGGIGYTWTPRNGNEVAHLLAAHQNAKPQILEANSGLPSHILEIIAKEQKCRRHIPFNREIHREITDHQISATVNTAAEANQNESGNHKALAHRHGTQTLTRCCTLNIDELILTQRGCNFLRHLQNNRLRQQPTPNKLLSASEYVSLAQGNHAHIAITKARIPSL